MQPAQPATTFTSSLTTVLTLLGVAVGLGNVWRFPYMMGTHGGSAFLLVFVAMMFLIAVPALMCELALARTHRGATITVLHRSFGPVGRVLGYALVVGVLCSGSYYTLVVGNVFYSAWFVITTGFSNGDLEAFSAGLGNPGLQFSIGLGVLWLALFVIWRGLRGGIERISKVFVPVFFLIAIYLVYIALTLPGATAAVAEFLRPDFSRIGITEIFAALGQCFFSVGLGASFVLVYGKFISNSTNLGGVALVSASGDTIASMLATLFIVPTIMVFGLDLAGGPALLFDTLPRLLAAMEGGRVTGSLLLIALALVSFLSAVAVFQVVTVALGEEPIGRCLGRVRLLLLVGGVETLLMLYPAWHPEIIAVLDLVIGSGFMLSGGLLAVIAITWCHRRAAAMDGIFGSGEHGVLDRLVFLWMRYVIPVALTGILAATTYGALSAGP